MHGALKTLFWEFIPQERLLLESFAPILPETYLSSQFSLVSVEKRRTVEYNL